MIQQLEGSVQTVQIHVVPCKYPLGFLLMENVRETKEKGWQNYTSSKMFSLLWIERVTPCLGITNIFVARDTKFTFPEILPH